MFLLEKTKRCLLLHNTFYLENTFYLIEHTSENTFMHVQDTTCPENTLYSTHSTEHILQTRISKTDKASLFLAPNSDGPVCVFRV